MKNRPPGSCLGRSGPSSPDPCPIGSAPDAEKIGAVLGYQRATRKKFCVPGRDLTNRLGMLGGGRVCRGSGGKVYRGRRTGANPVEGETFWAEQPLLTQPGGGKLGA